MLGIWKEFFMIYLGSHFIWKVKHISSCAIGESIVSGQAYIVIEKNEGK